MSTMTAKELNEEICRKYGLQMQLNDGEAVLETVDIRLRPGEFPTIIAEYVIVKDKNVQENNEEDKDAVLQEMSPERGGFKPDDE